MYSLNGEYPDSPAESEESVTDESPDNEGGFSQAPSPFGSGVSRGGPTKNLTSRRESTAEKQRKWAVRTFTLFLASEGITKPLEEMRQHELNQHLKKFYKEAKRKDGCDFSKPGLTNIRNALDRYIKTILNFTILKSTEFEDANKAFDEKISMIEGNAASPWRHSVSINPQDMQKILASGVIGGSAPLLLLRACWFNILLHFDVGDHLKQRRLSKQQFVIHCDSSGQERVKMMNCHPYQQGVPGNTSLPTTMHSVPGHPLCPVALLKKYLSKLHPESDALFQCPVQYKVDDSVPVWYEKQAVGVHALEGMMTCISKEARLSRVYTNGCLRKSSSLVYLQCGFGYDTRNITSDSSATIAANTSMPSSSGVTYAASSHDRISQLPSPSAATSRCDPFQYPVDNKHIPLYHSPVASQPPRFENTGNSTFSPIGSPVNVNKQDHCTTSKRGQQPFVPSDNSQPRTAIGVCMPTVKIEEGVSSICEGTSMGVQPTFPSESIDFPSVTDSMSIKRESFRNLSESTSGPTCTRQSIASESPPSDLSSKTYLHVEILGGKSFIDFEHCQTDPGQQAPTLTLHINFRGQRFKSSPTACCVNPDLTQDLYLELYNRPSVDSNTLLNITDPLSLILSKKETNDKISLIGSHCFYWQKVFKESSGVLNATIDVNGMGEESKMMIGALQMRLQILTNGQQHVQPNIIDSHLSNVQSRISERERRFMGYARQWWKDYMSGCPSHSRQQVKIFAQDECGTSKPVVSFITPIDSGYFLESPRHAARFVSLLKHEEECSMFGSKVDSWSSLHSFLCRGKGSCEDHSILLCSLLLGFGLDASVCLGTKDTGQPHAWVMSRHLSGKIVFWESLTGQRYELTKNPATVCPQYRTLGCIFNNLSLYANIQASGLISTCDFDVNNASKWKAMDHSAIHAVCGSDIQPSLPIPPSLSPPTIHIINVSKKLEQELKSAIEDYRQGIGFSVQWDETLSNVLSPCLAANEIEARTGLTPNIEELREPVYKYLTRQMSFQSVTTCINHFHVNQAIADIQSLQEFHAIIDCNEDGLQFALRVQVHPYPDDMCAAWIVFAAKYPAKDREPTYQWNVVNLHSQTL